MKYVTKNGRNFYVGDRLASQHEVEPSVRIIEISDDKIRLKHLNYDELTKKGMSVREEFEMDHLTFVNASGWHHGTEGDK